MKLIWLIDAEYNIDWLTFVLTEYDDDDVSETGSRFSLANISRTSSVSQE